MKYTAVPKLLRRLLDEKEMSQADFAMRMGVSKKTISETMNGLASISPKFAICCEYVLGIRASDLTIIQMHEQLDEARKIVDVSCLPPAWSRRMNRKKPGPQPKPKSILDVVNAMLTHKSPMQPMREWMGGGEVEYGTGDGSEIGVGALDARQREHKKSEKAFRPKKKS